MLHKRSYPHNFQIIFPILILYITIRLVRSVASGHFSIKVTLKDGADVDLVCVNRGFGDPVATVNYPTLRGSKDRKIANDRLDKFFHDNIDAQNAVRFLKEGSRDLNLKMPGYVLEHLVMNVGEQHGVSSGRTFFVRVAQHLSLGEKSPFLNHMISDAQKSGDAHLEQNTGDMLRKNGNHWDSLGY
jgi:hypothetical protein